MAPVTPGRTPEIARAEQDARALLSSAVAAWREHYPGVRVTLAPAHSMNPVVALLDASRDAGLLVVSRHGGNVVTRLVCSSVGDAAVRQAPCPVAVVPETSTVEGEERTRDNGVLAR
jgi:nucleotide-binding universal stress UspA family protein